MKFGIAFKLGCLLALFGVLVCGLTGYYSYSSSRATLLKAAERDLLTATQVLGRNLRGSIDGVARDALLMAEVSRARDLPRVTDEDRREHSEHDLAELFRAQMQVHPEYMQIRLISATGHGLEQVRIDRDGERLLKIGGAKLQEKGHYAYVFDTLRLPPGEVRLSPIVINHELGAHSGLGKPTLHVSTPVADADGKAGALIVINVDLDQLFAQIKSDLPSHYQVYLSNRWGDLLIHPDHRRTFGFDQGRRLFIQEEFPEVAALLDEDKESSLVSHARDSAHDLVAAFVRLTVNASSPERFIVLGLAQPEDHVLAETNRLGQRIVQVVILSSLLTLAIAIIASRAMTHSLKSITLAVEQFTRERRSGPLPVQRQDELGQLARSFAQMQEEILDQLDELNQSRNALEHLARHDALTGLPNRRMFFERLEHALANARRSAMPLAVLFVDLDHFKQLNDSLGHGAGDRVLQAVANLLRSATRESDTVARLGGDEFVILIEQMDDPQRVIAVLHKLHERFQLPMLLDGHEVQVQASMGVSLFPRDGDDIESLLQQADRAMYAAKNAGRNTYSYEAHEQR
ncbi:MULTISPECIES: diguanylate cyclase [unclassified Pseudomonas]|uniref:diguanylate cyclase domain-containing protein n=1 Tax=unclassified Pseudomonas TaxID=196821 RepID=UPI0024482CBD|nr:MULTISPECIES: diguanylate cyclase [unclassified Pseudomonas]MDG9922155.1 diguanylate cyclase [Pseudomonas sp. GD04045]MDH0033752.1 diguanylate cyclase [Pseudomonas sp. GD04019]